MLQNQGRPLLDLIYTKCIPLVTAHIRSLWESNVFSRICVFTSDGWGMSPCDNSHGTPNLQPPRASWILFTGDPLLTCSLTRGWPSTERPSCFNYKSESICFVVIEQEESESPKSRSKRPTTASGRTFINFVSAKQRAISSKAANKTKQRGAKLLQVTWSNSMEFPF